MKQYLSLTKPHLVSKTQSPESPGGPREPGSWDPDSRSKADPPAVTQLQPEPWTRASGPPRVCAARGKQRWTAGCRKEPWLGFPCTAGNSDTTAGPAWSSASTRPRPASVLEAVAVSARTPARAVSSSMPTPLNAKKSQV